jgi:hypothetical protein
MRETTRHREAFNAYWELGAGRSLSELPRAFQALGKQPPSRRSLAEWSRQFHWQDRIADLERTARDADDAERREAIREMAERHAREGLLLQQKGAEWLNGLETEQASADAAIRAVVEGARLERLARGEATDRIVAEPDAHLERLSDAELEDLITHVGATLAREDTEESRGSERVGDGPPTDSR